MPPRLIRRCLLFGLLGLVTSVAVAWGAGVRMQLWPRVGSDMTTGVAVVDGVIQRVYRHRQFGWASENWVLEDTTIESFNAGSRRQKAKRIEQLGGPAFDDEVWEVGSALMRDVGRTPPPKPSISRRIDDVARQGPPAPAHDIADMQTDLWRFDVGWPLLALRSTGRTDMSGAAPNERGIPTSIDTRQEEWTALVIPWSWGSWPAGQWTPDTLTLPWMPRLGLLLNTIFYALLWFVILLIPRAIRRRIRRARGRCPKCGYSLAGQAAPGCPECSAGREALATA